MPDIFDQIAAEQTPQTPTPQAGGGDIFDRIAAEQSSAPPMSRAEQQIPGVGRLLDEATFADAQRLGDTGVTPGTAMEFAALHVDHANRQRQEANQPGLDEREQLAIADIYKGAAGGQLGGMSNQDFYAQQREQSLAARRETLGGRITDAAARGAGNLAETGLRVLSSVAPETARELRENTAATYAVDPNSVAGMAGNFGMEAVKMATLAKFLNPVGQGAFYAGQGFGGSRLDTAELRNQGQRVSGGAEAAAALGIGAIEGASGYVGGELFERMSAIVRATPAIQSLLKAGDTQAVKQFLGKALQLGGTMTAEGAEEAATQFLGNWTTQKTTNPKQKWGEGVVEAGVTGAALSPLGELGTRGRVGAQEQVAAPAAKFRPDETLVNLKRQLREERVARRTDPLTKAPNEVQYHEDATRIFADADTRNESIAIVETDVGGLKVMNTVYGHAGGDEMLGKVHELMAEELRMPPQKDRPEDYLGSAAYRIGGDEFPAILRGIEDRAGVKAAMDRVNGKFDSWLAAQYPDLPAEARPFIAWDAVIRKPGDATAVADLRKQADAGVEAEKSAIKAQRNVPEGRTELLDYITKHKQPPTGEAAQPPETAKAISPAEPPAPPVRKENGVGNLTDPGTKVEWTDAQGQVVAGTYESRAVDGAHWVRSNGQLSKVADVAVAADQGKPTLEQRAKPAIPGEARDWSYTKLKGWANANGYDISKADNIRGLRLRVAEQRGDSLTDLPQRPTKAWGWNARRLRDWAEANGYTIPGEAKTPREIKESIDTQRGESIARGKEVMGQLNKGPGERKALEGVQTPEVPQIAAETPEQATAREEAVKASIARATREKPNEMRALTSQVQGAAGKAFAPMWSRIQDLSSAIFGRLKRREFDTNTAIEQGQRESLPLMEQLTDALGGRGSAKYNEFSRAIQSQDFAAAKALLPESARAAVDQLSTIRRQVFDEARANGVNAGDIGSEHWPRFVKDLTTLRASVGTEELGQIEAAWKQAELNRGGPLQTAEKMEIANKVTTGHGPKKPGAVGPPNARERRIDKLTIDQVPLYGDFLESHMKYLEQMITAGERAKLLGKSDDPAMLKESVGKLVYDEITAGNLKPENQAEMTGLLQTLLTGESARASKGVRIATQLIHLATLGQLRTAWNQVIDTAFAAGMYGFKSTGVGIKAALGFAPAERTVAMREVGLNDRGTEFREVGKLARAVGKTMTASGLSRFDRFSKELVMSAAHDHYQKMASDPAGEAYKGFERKYRPMLGEAEFNKTVADYKSGQKTARTGFVEFVEVSKVQPTSLMSMPEAYIKNPNARILYTLRSFQISQLSFVARDGIRKLGSKVPGERAEGVKTLARFATTMLLANMGKDLLYKFLHGEDVKPEDLPLSTVNSILSLVGLSTHLLKQAKSDPAAAALRFVSPPLGFVTDVWKDVTGQSWGTGSKAVRYIPLAGDALYYWAPFGHGYHAKKEAAKADFNASLLDMRRRAYTAYIGGDPGAARAWVDKHNELLPAGEKRMTLADAEFPPRDTSERAASKSRMEQATTAYKAGDMNAANAALEEENQNQRPSARKNRRDLEKRIERAKARGEM